MKCVLSVVLSGLCILVLTCVPVWGQVTAQISGTVKDQSGAVLPGVEVTVTQTETGVMRSAVTNETGNYVLPTLPLGPYKLEAALPGFRTFVQRGIVLDVGSNPVVNAVLEVGQVTERVEVQANAALVETRNSGVGQVMENQRILELPLNGRNVTELISLSGATSSYTAGTADGINIRNPFTTTVVSIAGGLSTGVYFSLDGANHMDPFTNTSISIPFPDALQEFKVETSAMNAQTGVKSGGSVSLVTKSGTNEIHGDAFEFVRNGMFNARNFFAVRRDTLKRNQFGATVGMPVLKNKVFLFGGYQGTTLRQDPSDLIAFVPTAATLSGDFTTFASAACNGGKAITLKAPFVNNQIDRSKIDPAAIALSKKLPTPDDACGRVHYGNQNLKNQHMGIARVDYQRSANHSIFGRYLADSVDNPAPATLSHNALSSGVNGAVGLNQAIAFGDTYLFGSNIVNSFRLSANRSESTKTEAKYFGFSDIGINSIYSYLPGEARVAVTGGFSLGASGGPTKLAIYNINDDVSMTRGNHQLTLGVNAAHWRSNYYDTNYANGNFSFNGGITGIGMADFLIGQAITFDEAPPGQHNSRQYYLSVYAADTWKATQRLTVNYGLRWEPYFPQQNTDKGVSHFDMNAFLQGIRSRVFVNGPPGQFFPGDPGFPSLAGQYNQLKQFSPRLGLAWDPKGDGKTSIRAAAGTFVDLPSVYFQGGLNVTAPWDPHVVVNNVSFENPWANYPGGNPFPVTISSTVPFTLHNVVTTMDYNTHNAHVYQWNLSVQREVAPSWLVSATYLGSHSIHLWSIQSINHAVYFPGNPVNGACTAQGFTLLTTTSPCSTTANTDSRRILGLINPSVQEIGYLDKVDDGGTASYNGLLLALQHRVNRGITMNANYTWSHCITDPFQTSIAVGGTGNTGYINPDNRHLDRGNCTSAATDRRHLFNFTSVAETPKFSNARLSSFVSGWRLSPILKFQSGDYVTVTTSTDVALNGVGNQRPNQILGSPYGNKSINNYLNPFAFAPPATGTFGNAGVGAIRGPWFWQFDVALSRDFQIREGKRIEVRAEAFNILNGVRFNDPTASINSSIFGQITAAQDPRIMQFALKYLF